MRIPTAILRAVRFHQWVKNILVFVPLVMAHKILHLGMLGSTAQAFLAYGLVASSAYLLNDLRDLESDRTHPVKMHRPFASGDLPLAWGKPLALLLLIAGLLASLPLPARFLFTILVYLFFTVAYTLLLKRIPLVDVITLAGLYTLRIIGGGAAADVPVSPWLISFSMFFFLSLAFIKRFSELSVLSEENRERVYDRNYVAKDLELIRSLGVTSGFLSVLVLAMYISGREVTVLYSRPFLLWLNCPILLYWISRMWLLANRGIILEDPLDFAIKDRMSYLVGTLTAIFMALAI